MFTRARSLIVKVWTRPALGKYDILPNILPNLLGRDWGDFLWFWWLPFGKNSVDSPRRKAGLLVNILVWLVGS